MPLKGFEVGEQRLLQSLGVSPATAVRTPPARMPSATHPRLRRSTRRAYSPKCVEGVFCELRPDGFLRSTAQPRSNTYRGPAVGPGQRGFSANVVNFAYVAFGTVGAEGGAGFRPVRVYR